MYNYLRNISVTFKIFVSTDLLYILSLTKFILVNVYKNNINIPKNRTTIEKLLNVDICNVRLFMQ